MRYLTTASRLRNKMMRRPLTRHRPPIRSKTMSKQQILIQKSWEPLLWSSRPRLHSSRSRGHANALRELSISHVLVKKSRRSQHRSSSK